MADVLVGGVMAAALAEHRDRCNALVAEAQRSSPRFDTLAMERQLRGPVADAVEACDRLLPGAGSRVLAAVFPGLVDLVAQGRVGGGASHDALVGALAELAAPLVEQPRVVFASLANAIVHLEGRGLDAVEWLRRVVGARGGAATTLQVGQVAAWGIGAAHFRDGALDVAGELEPATLAHALGATEALPDDAVARFRADRWWRPQKPAASGFVGRVGGFRGFGGPFLASPVVMVSGDRIVVHAEPDRWLLHADAFGATLTRTDAVGVAMAPDLGLVPPGFRPTSMARAGDVGAVTVASSYEVAVLAVVG